MTFIIEDFPWADGALAPIAENQQQGVSLSVPTDGSAPGVVVFATPYATSVQIQSLVPQAGPAPSGWNLSWEAYNITLTGFDIIVTGGPAPPTGRINMSWTVNGT